MSNRAAVSLALICSLAMVGCSSKQEQVTAPAAYDVEEVPLAQISADLAAGKTTAVAVTQAYIDRIKKYDGPLHAVIAVAPDALEQAAASDARRKDGKTLGPMDGIPVMFKDNIGAVGMPNTAGSFALEHNVPTQDAELVRRLRAGGAIILGKLNTSQFAGLRAMATFNGSTVGGVAHNPYDLAKSPAGSSSGSGIAAATSFAAATVGTDTTGSVVGPSSVNGLVGMRPTVGLISRTGIVPLSMTMDTAGPLARNVTDFAMMLTIMAGSDPSDPATAEADAHKSDYTKALDPNALQGQKLGVFRNTRAYDEHTKVLLDEAIAVMKAHGAEVIELPADILEDMSPETLGIMSYEFKEDIAAYLTSAPPSQKARTLADIIAAHAADPREGIVDQGALELSESRNGRADPEYRKMLEYAKRRAGPEGYGRAFTEFGVSAVIGINSGPAGVLVPNGTVTERSSNRASPKGTSPPSMSGNAAIAGYPNMSVPMGLVEGMPVGLSLTGPAWSEAKLVGIAYAYEQASRKRVPPAAYKMVGE
ncbi:MAG TPA: amidase family protein [Povalibacter sp.]|nr:amidase family protein [Povalibacter sp.]